MRLESLRTILALAVIHDLDITSSAYLHGTLKEELYMDHPEGFVAPGKMNADVGTRNETFRARTSRFIQIAICSVTVYALIASQVGFILIRHLPDDFYDRRR